jgi:uncharacterized membrane protein
LITSGKKTLSFKMKGKEAMEDAVEALFDMNGIYSILFSAGTVAEKLVSENSISYAIDEKHGIIIITDYI